MAITITQGDLLAQDVDALINTVNCVGVMGKGIALQFKNKWPENFKAYHRACKRGELRPGLMFVQQISDPNPPRYIINFPTKQHWREKSKIRYIDDGLQDLIRQINRLGIRSIAIPPLGCGNGGLDWNQVKPRIEQAFAELTDVDVRLFEPDGAPSANSITHSNGRALSDRPQRL